MCEGWEICDNCGMCRWELWHIWEVYGVMGFHRKRIDHRVQGSVTSMFSV